MIDSDLIKYDMKVPVMAKQLMKEDADKVIASTRRDTIIPARKGHIGPVFPFYAKQIDFGGHKGDAILFTPGDYVVWCFGVVTMVDRKEFEEAVHMVDDIPEELEKDIQDHEASASIVNEITE
jgi:hypothetical protein